VILLTGMGEAEAALTISPAMLTFADQQVNTTSPAQVITVTNTGTAPLTVSSVTPTGPFATTDTCKAAPVAAGGICTASVTFTPTAAGSAIGTVTITGAANTVNSPQTVSLTGTGVATPIVSLSSTALTFASLAVGVTSTAQTVTLTNTGTAALSITSITASGDFAATNTCGASVAAGANCAITVTFTPTAVGSRSGTITITDNAQDSPQTVTLAGTGQATPAVTLSPTSLSFANQPIGTSSAVQTITLSNSGTATLNITSITGSGDFTESNTCGSTVAAGANCSISVVFTPSVAGTRTGSVTITDDAPGSPQSVGLGGSGSDFSLRFSTTSLTILAGQTGTFAVSVTPSFGFNTQVSLSCSGAPAMSTCSLSPSSVTLDGVNPSNVNGQLQTTVRSLVPPVSRPHMGPPSLGRYPMGWLIFALGLMMMAGLALRRRLAWAGIALVLLLALTWMGCGNGVSPTTAPGTPAGTYTLTVKGTSGTVSHTATLSVTVQ
jgi:HYDIN/CFA65/VesB-like, Ig-like domain/Abnormal spindle-like microcephaly-assoc'd, ASPM-SPD-2-Hydin